MLPLRPEALSDEAIHRVSLELGLHLPHKEQWEYLQQLATRDVQAAPGCGKTTLTAAKLCLLASGWQSNTLGICVLSHTNVAKDEIMRIVSGHPTGRKLLGYPHFVGTIQAFTHTFLAMPGLRGQGIEVRVIDDEAYAQVAERRLAWRKYATLAGAAQRRADIPGMIRNATLFFEGNSLKIRPASGDFPFSETSDSAKQYEQLKRDLLADGYLRYADMYALAQAHASRYPFTVEALRKRFPVVIIDEAQDTSASQEAFLASIFSHAEVTIERIGDINQKIFGESVSEEGGSFPIADALLLPQTMRFGQQIAAAASKLATAREQEIIGNPERDHHQSLMLILFDEGSISQVADTFCQEVAARVPHEDIAKYGVRILGARKQGSGTAFPSTLRSYFPEYQAPPPPPQVTALMDACLRARSLAAENSDTVAASECLWEAVTECLTLCKVRFDGRRPTRARVLDKLGSSSIATVRELKQALYELAFLPCKDEATWKARVLAFSEILLGTVTRTTDFDGYCAYESSAANISAPSPPARAVDNSHGIRAKLSTIHSAKGETHAATLVLECCSNRIHDLKEVLPVVIGKHNPKRLQVKTVQEDMRNIFVAMTRARHLVAFAVLKDHIADMVADFKSSGWHIVDLTVVVKE